MVNRNPFFAPDRMRTTLTFDLRFTAPAATLLAPWSTELIVMTNPNIFTSVSVSVPGYTPLAGIYRKYRVRSGRLTYKYANGETFPTEMFATPVNFLPNLATDPTKYLSMQNSRRKIVSAKGGIDHGTVTTRASIAAFGGAANTTVDDDYVGTTDNSAPPVNNLYFIYGFLTNGVATAAGSMNVITVSIEIDFFELQSPAT